MSACSCSGWVVEGTLLISLSTNETETWKHLELYESKNNSSPVTNVKCSSAFSTENFYDSFPVNIFENFNWQYKRCQLIRDTIQLAPILLPRLKLYVGFKDFEESMKTLNNLVQALSQESCKAMKQPYRCHCNTEAAYRDCKTVWLFSLCRSCEWESSKGQFHGPHVRISIHLK